MTSLHHHIKKNVDAISSNHAVICINNFVIENVLHYEHLISQTTDQYTNQNKE